MSNLNLAAVPTRFRGLPAEHLVRSAVLLLGAAGGALVVLGVRLPWLATFGGLLTRTGWGTRNGDVLLALGVLAPLLGLLQAARSTSSTRWALALTGLATTGLAGYLLIQALSAKAELGGMVLAQLGPGLPLAAAGGAAGLATAFLPMPAARTTPAAVQARSRVAGLRSPWRYAAAGCALVAGLAHVPVTPAHLEEAPYIGVLFLLLTVACVLGATMLLIADTALLYRGLALVCVLAVAGYVVSRTVGLPLMGDDVGNWLEPLGVVCVLAELGVAAAAGAALRSGRPLED